MSDEKCRLMISAPERDPDIYYRTKLFTPDPYALLILNGESILFASDLEIGRAMEVATVDKVESFTQIQKRLKEDGIEKPGYTAVVHDYIKKHVGTGVKIEVPGSMEVRYVEKLREYGYDLAIGEVPFWPERRHKDAWEIEQIAAAMRATEEAIASARETIWHSEARDGTLYSDGQILTAERVRAQIEMQLLEAGYQGAPPIVSSGEFAAMPHEIGSGPLRTGETVIIDVFPRCKRTYYHADETRTVVHGMPSDTVVKMHGAVADAVKMTLEGIRPGVDGKILHKKIQELFENQGFETRTVDDKPEGFFHGTGHGVGLEVHEAPRIGGVAQVLEIGDVVTVEPGLYYPGIGGVRIEELVVVTEDGCRNLASLDWKLTE